MKEKEKRIRELDRIAYDPYVRIDHPTTEDWRRSYDALKELCDLVPEESDYPNTLGYLCYYGRHTGGERQYEEARVWFVRGAGLHNIESTYKLADMLMDGLGGPADPECAGRMYLYMYWVCRDQFERGLKECSFADTALRLGRLYHEGKLPQKNDLEALGYLLEAKFALDWRKLYNQYGDFTVEKNILRLLDECEKPEDELLKADFYGIGLGRVPHYLLTLGEYFMTIDFAFSDEGGVRLEFRRKRKDGEKPAPILWSVPPAMRCFMTDFVVLYGEDIRQIRRKDPDRQVVCDRYEYDETSGMHLFYLGDEVQCGLQGGDYVLPMHEFMTTAVRDHPGMGSSIPQ